ncbi:Pentatricopeptide repeat-containing protein [Acorus gramineus]|uniref:Pentatricopeptide repeat-containing protein n=1 Tax=Acorus gramineus TaxID=55184 RepID=A0AAV9BCJ1_ACOGR|nr:Pentatricopeptide repeat-containing protein [Acorus gramineus]
MGAVGFLARKMTALHHPHLSHSLTAFLSLSELKITHAHIITSGLSADLFSICRLLASAAISVSAADLRYAETLFDNVDTKTLFMYNTMIRGFSQSDRPLEAIRFYVGMLRTRISPDRFTFPFAIRSCAVSDSVGLGRGLHCSCLKLGLDSDVFVVNNSITMYSSFGDMDSARALFEERSTSVDVVSWTALIAGYSDRGDVDSARRFFDRMPERNTVSWNAMIAGYARVGSLEEAMRLFNAMPERDAASWGALVSGCAHCGRCGEALGFFEEMVRTGVRPNEPALVSAISACTQMRALEKGEWIHSLIIQENYEVNVTLGTALLDMYGKCGNIDRAREVFNGMRARNVFAWNTMIAGLALNGCGKQVLTLFWKMQLTGLSPNDVTFVALLTSCSHSGLVEEGLWFFDLMARVYDIRPLEEHYGCVIDMLGRAGLMREAMDFVEGMPVEPHPGLWGALAGACGIHGDVKVGEELGKRLIELEPGHGGRYMLLSNLYATARRWDDVAMVRDVFKQRGKNKVPGNSIVQT